MKDLWLIIYLPIFNVHNKQIFDDDIFESFSSKLESTAC